MIIHKTRKSECEISIDRYRNVCEKAKFWIQFIETLPGNAYKDGIKDNDMLDYRLQSEAYWMKTCPILYP